MFYFMKNKNVIYYKVNSLYCYFKEDKSIEKCIFMRVKVKVFFFMRFIVR